MRPNRKVPKNMSKMTTRTMCVGAILLTFFVMVILNLMASSRCTQLMKSIGKKEALIQKQRDDLARAQSRWDQTKSSINIQLEMNKHGLAMSVPRPIQTIRMNTKGLPYQGQTSVAYHRNRASNIGSASASSNTRQFNRTRARN